MSEFLRFHPLAPFLHMEHPVVRSCLRAWVQECNLLDSPAISPHGNHHRKATRRTIEKCNVQCAKSKSCGKRHHHLHCTLCKGVGVTHMSFKVPMPGGGARISYEFHVNVSEFLCFHHLAPFLRMRHPVVRSCLRAWVQECNLPDSAAFWATTAVNMGRPREQQLKSAMCNVQKVRVVEKDITTSIANFGKFGGG